MEIGKIIEERYKPQEKKKGGVNSSKSYAVEQLMVFMGEKPEGNTKRFKYWLGRTRKLDSRQIYEFMSRAKESKNPPALFNWFLKKHNEENKK